MNKEQAKIEIRNFLPVIQRHQEDKFLDSLTGLFTDPVGWLMYVDKREFRRIIKKYYYKTYKYQR